MGSKEEAVCYADMLTRPGANTGRLDWSGWMSRSEEAYSWHAACEPVSPGKHSRFTSRTAPHEAFLGVIDRLDCAMANTLPSSICSTRARLMRAGRSPG